MLKYDIKFVEQKYLVSIISSKFQSNAHHKLDFDVNTLFSDFVPNIVHVARFIVINLAKEANRNRDWIEGEMKKTAEMFEDVVSCIDGFFC